MTDSRTTINKSTSDKLTNSLVKWIVLDCRPLLVVEDKGVENVLQIATCDPAFQLLCKKSNSSKIQHLYDTEKQAKLDALQKVEFVALEIIAPSFVILIMSVSLHTLLMS